MTTGAEGNRPCRRASAGVKQRVRAADARTLYLLPEDTLHLSSTGEALVATRPDGEVSRLPAARLLRVVCSERVNWSGAALGLCQAHGITVTWLDGRGAPLGHLYPAAAPRTDLAELLDGLTSLPGAEWAQAHDNWLRRQRLAVLNRWRAGRLAARHPVHPDEWRRAVQAWVYRNEVGAHLPPVLQGLIGALVASRLAAWGLSTRYWCFGGRSVELAADLSRLVWAELNLSGGPVVQAMQRTREAAAMFERWSTTCADLMHGHLASLKSHALRELRG
jgi:hypothetical protein